MNGEQRKAARVALPQAVKATVDDVPVRLLNLSTVNACVEHERRFPLESPRLRLEWNRSEIRLPFRVMRSQRVSRPDAEPLYQSGIEFVALEPLAIGMIASILQWAEQSAAAREAQASSSGTAEAGEDTWIRKVKKLRNDRGE